MILIRACLWDGRRNVHATRLRRELGGVIVPDRTRSARDTFIAALERQGEEDAWHLEDDAIPTSDWRAKADAVVAAQPGRVIQGYSNWKADLTQGSRLMPGPSFFSALCFFLPGDLAPYILAHARAMEDPRRVDPILRPAIRHYWLHVPSLVNHAPFPSLCWDRRRSSRGSRTFVA